MLSNVTDDAAHSVFRGFHVNTKDWLIKARVGGEETDIESRSGHDHDLSRFSVSGVFVDSSIIHADFHTHDGFTSKDTTKAEIAESRDDIRFDAIEQLDTPRHVQ